MNTNWSLANSLSCVDQTSLDRVAQQIANLECKINMLYLRYRAQIAEEEIDRFFNFILQSIVLDRFHEQENHPELN